jgi:hypothetical protein
MANGGKAMPDPTQHAVDLSQALLVPFAAGFVLQRFLEIVDPFTTAFIEDPNRKKLVLAVVSLILGCAISGWAQVHIFEALGHPFSKTGIGHFLEVLSSGIFISAGTEGFNSLLKFANYKKEASKADAAAKKSQVSAKDLAMVNPQPQS